MRNILMIAGSIVAGLIMLACLGLALFTLAAGLSGCKAFNMPDNLHNPLSVEAEDAEE